MDLPRQSKIRENVVPNIVKKLEELVKGYFDSYQSSSKSVK